MIACTLTSPVTAAVELVAFDGKHFLLRSAQAFAPGQPLTLKAQLGSELVLDLKSLGSVRREQGFDVRARALTLTREARAQLVAHFGA